jgi:adenylate kinase
LVQRDDDREDIVRNRLEVYHSQTSPLIGFYQGMSGDSAPGYHRIEGVGSMDDIRDKVFASLEA